MESFGLQEIRQLVDEFFYFFQRKVFSISGQDISMGQLLLLPSLLIVGYLLTRWLIAVVASRLRKHNVNADVIHLIRRIFYIIAIAILVITILDLLSVPLTAFAFVSGAVAIGVGFGAQNIINNFISGWILMWERPIRIGDFMEIGADKGTVEAINTRSTRIRRVDGVHILVPNSALLENIVVNWTLIDRNMRTFVRVGVAYGSPVRKVADLIMQAVQQQKDVLLDPKPMVYFEDFGDSALVFDVFFWISASVERDLRIVRSDLRFAITDLFQQNDIVIAFPQRDVHVDGALTLHSAVEEPSTPRGGASQDERDDQPDSR